MELKDFLSETLKQIITGIQDAQDFTEKEGRGAKINPRGITSLKKNGKGQKQPHDLKTKLPVESVEFDIAVSISNTNKNSGGGKLRIYVLDIGGGFSTNSENTTVSRIKFAVPLVLPDPYAK